MKANRTYSDRLSLAWLMLETRTEIINDLMIFESEENEDWLHCGNESVKEFVDRINAVGDRFRANTLTTSDKKLLARIANGLTPDTADLLALLIMIYDRRKNKEEVSL